MVIGFIMNKDEAERCTKLGLEAMKGGDISKATRLFQKSMSLFPTEEAARCLEIASSKQQGPVSPETARKTASSQPAPSPPPNYTREQEIMCRELLQKTDFYDILGLQKTASQDELKKSYRKLALKLHPDKNQAPSASEAFKKINKSFACLSDEVKRKRYDQTGQEDIQGIEMNGFNNGDFAEHIFREFFNESFFAAGPGFHRVYRTQSGFHFNNHAQTNPAAAGRNQFTQFLPILVLIILSVASNFQMSSSEVFSFHYTTQYSVKKITENLNIEYYLQPAYAKELTYNERITLENKVEQVYFNYLAQECENQKAKKNMYLNKAKYYRGASAQTYKEYAELVSLESCMHLQQLQAK